MIVNLKNKQISVIKQALIIMLAHAEMTTAWCYEIHDAVDSLQKQFPGVLPADIHLRRTEGGR